MFSNFVLLVKRNNTSFHLFQPEIVEDDFIIRRYVKIVNEGGVVKRKFVRKAFQLGDYRSDFVKFLRHQNQEDNSHNIVFVDQVSTTN